MASVHIFISHASKDDHFVKDLRTALESQQLPVWVDSRNLRGGAKLAPEISKAIKQARQTIVVLSPNTINSPWVRREVQQALADAGNTAAEHMASVPIMAAADCLRYLGRLDEVVAAYEEGIRRAEKLGDRRGVAGRRTQLGTARLLQKRYGGRWKVSGKPSVLSSRWASRAGSPPSGIRLE